MRERRQSPHRMETESRDVRQSCTTPGAHTQRFADKRSSAVVQGKLVEMMHDSLRLSRQLAPGDARHDSPRVADHGHRTRSLPGEENSRAGLPGRLKSGIESLSGMSMDHVKVHYNSSKPAQLQAHAYAQGSEIHVAPGQERHLAHEAWHLVQQAQGRVRPTLQMKMGAINDDRSLETEADVMGAKAARVEGGHDTATPAAAPVRTAPVQRVVKVGAMSYQAPTGKATTELIARIDQALEAVGKRLTPGWKGTLREWVRDDQAVLHDFADEDALRLALEVIYPPKTAASGSTKRKADIDLQDEHIRTLTTGADDGMRKRARLLSDHSGKAWSAMVGDVSGWNTVTATARSLEALPSGVMDATPNIASTIRPFDFFAALNDSGKRDKLDRMDFNFGGTQVVTHGYESQGNRALAPRGSYDTAKGKSKKFLPFKFNTVKIGNDIGTYAQHQSAQPADFMGSAFTALNTLEKYRLPEQAFGTSIKRDLMGNGEFNTQQGIGQNHPHANVEFLGATAGSGLNNQQVENMRLQQELSNIRILESGFLAAPDRELGEDMQDKKNRTTLRAIHEQLEVVMGSASADRATRKAAKKQLRRLIKRAMASIERLPGIESDDEVSDTDI